MDKSSAGAKKHYFELICRGASGSKGADFRTISCTQIAEVAAELNDRPRLCLNDRSPRQVMKRYQHQLAASNSQR